MLSKEPVSRPQMKKGASSLRSVAELAGVSVATASRVMSGSSHPVSEKTRQQVLSAADRLSFVPNRLARALVTSKSQTAGVIVHDVSDPYFGDIVKGLEDGLHAHDYRLFVASSDRDPEKELSYVRAFDAYQVDALVFAASSMRDTAYANTLRELAARFRSRGAVIVLLSDHFLEGPRVAFDNRRAVTEMVDYLAGRGHEHITFISGPPDLEVSQVRHAAFTEAMDRLGLDTGPGYVADGRFNAEGGEAAMAELLSRVDTTAVLAANDLMAIGASHHLRSAGLNVPCDVSVAGIDDVAMARYAPVPLTTMRVPTYEMGRSGAQLVLDALSGAETPDVQLVGRIIERESVSDLGSES